MNRTLQRRIELLEGRFVPAWEPLRIVVATSRQITYLASENALWKTSSWRVRTRDTRLC
jgi:hypothetical protein